jgi:radical SAM superfamily enzyme YgiQ (UPF0313 family)
MKKRVYFSCVANRYGDNVFLPYAAGLMWAYARQFPEIENAYELAGMLYLKEPIDKAVARLEDPDLVALSCYVWNWRWHQEFAKAVKARWPRCTVLVGGVQVPDENARILFDNPQFDFAIYGEGEGAFADFLREHTGDQQYAQVGSLMRAVNVGLSPRPAFVNPRREAVRLDQIRSPYIDGVFDELVADRRWRWQALQETNRGCPYASFGGDTYVALPDRIIRFDEEVYRSERTRPCPDSTHTHRLGVDERFVAQGLRNCLRVSFSNGLSLTVTDNHPLFKVREEKIVDVTARDLKSGDWVPVEVGQNNVADYVLLEEPSKTKAETLAAQGIGQGRRVPNSICLPKVLNESVAWLTGYLIGDGCLPSDNRASVMFAVKDRSRKQLLTIVPELFGVPLYITDACNTKKMQHGAIHSRKVVQFFRESLGVQSLEEKLTVPRGIFRSPKSVVRAFLDGLYCADGYWFRSEEPYVTTVSEKLAVECATLIHWIGDAASVRKIRMRGGFKNTKPWHYRVEWHGDRCRARVYGRPCVLSAVPAVRHTYRDRQGQLRLRHTPQDKRRDGSPREVLRYFEPRHVLLDARFVYVRVAAVEIAGSQETYDVHHHPEHKVAANGAYVRQCTMCEWGATSLNKLRQFPTEQIVAEFEWFGKHQVSFLFNCDANYAILKRDTELTQALIDVRERYGYPKQFRACFAKNSNDVVLDISRRLYAAGMHKATTLALQSLNEETLGLIKRKNIRYDRLAELAKTYEAEGIPTFTEIIVGLPGETFQTFVEGLDKVLNAHIHDGISIYLCVLLENTEMNTPEYIARHGIEFASLKALMYHGTPEPGVIEEVQDTIVATKTMPREDFRGALFYGWIVQGLHSFGMTQKLMAEGSALRSRFPHYKDFYLWLFDWATSSLGTVLGRALQRLSVVWDDVLHGKSWATVDERFGNVMWPPEEFLLLLVACESERFYDELRDELREYGSAIAEQRQAFIPPEPGQEAVWARDAVFYGRKGPGRRLRLRD